MLLSGSCLAGAMLGGVTRAERRQVAAYGRELGLAFQLKDDALDYDTAAEVLGKRRYADLAEGKITLPLILTLKRCTSSERDVIAAAMKEVSKSEASSPASGPPAEIEAVAELVARYHGVEDTLRRADESVNRAIDAIAAFPDSPAKQALVATAVFAVSRDH